MARKATTPYERREKVVTATMAYWFSMRGVTSNIQKASVIGVKSHKTVAERMKNPGTLTLAELWRLKDKLQIPKDDMARFFEALSGEGVS